MNKKVKTLCRCAIMIALAAVLSMVKIWQMPWGGSVTLFSMLPIAMIAVIYGTKTGLAVAFLYSVVQIGTDLGSLMGWSMTPAIWAGCLVFDYVIAYSAIGLSGIFRRHGKTGIAIGISLSLCIRFISHIISGTIFFSEYCWEGWNIVLYSICYNGAFMLPELVITVLGALLLTSTSPVKKLIAENGCPLDK